MSELHTFRAASMQEAFELVRDKLGSDAVILHTRQVAHRSWLPWREPRREVEITAGLGVNVASSGERRKTAATNRRVKSSPAGRREQRTSTGAATSTEERRSHPDSSISKSISKTRSQPEADLSALVAAAQNGSSPATESSASSGRSDANNDGGQNADFADKLDTIQKMLEQLGRNETNGGNTEIPGELFELYTELIDAEVQDDLARDLIFRLKDNGSAEQLGDAQAARSLLTSMVESDVGCSGPISPTPGTRKVVALVGPTGVGKTTTIAKLAANFRLRDGIRMGLVTVDTYRIAAVEQLRTYAEIIDLPMKVVTNPLEMRRALDELVGLDLVLIDTAGRSPKDELKINELKSLLAEADVDEVHLVLNLTSSLRSLEATAEKFSAAGTTSMILTKLDEAPGMGALLSTARKVNLPISYLTTGQDVPDDLEPAESGRIARLVLGQETLPT